VGRRRRRPAYTPCPSPVVRLVSSGNAAERRDYLGNLMEGHNTQSLPPALALLHSERPRNVSWFAAAALLFGDWGTSRLYVLGLAFLVAGRSSFWLILGMSALILAVGWAYSEICRIY